MAIHQPVHDNIPKKEHIKELIRTALILPEALDQWLPSFVEQGIAVEEKNANPQEVTAKVKEKIQSDAFLEDFLPAYDEIFTDEEISALVTFYKSEAMRKFTQKSPELQSPIFLAVVDAIGKVLEPYPLLAKLAVADEGIVPITSATFEQEVKQSSLPVIMDAYASWCGPCKMVSPIFDEVSKDWVGKVKFVKMDVDQEKALAKDLGVHAMPTFLFFKNGQLVGKEVGTLDKEGFNKAIKKNLGV